MNYYIISIRIAVIFSIMVFFTSAQTPIQKENNSIALILKIKGEGSKISEVSVYNFTHFNARIKDDNEKYLGSNPVHIKIKSDNDSTLFESFIENPLTKTFESFSETGVIERVGSTRNEEYINIRFKLPELVKHLNISCFQINEEKGENIISTFNLKIR